MLVMFDSILYDSDITAVLDLIVLILLILVLLIKFLSWFSESQMGTKTKIYGTRKYRVVLKYANKEKFQLFDTEELETLQYWLEKLVYHITIYNMYMFYSSREMVQSWLRDYYTNLQCLFSEYKALNNGKVSKKEYETVAAFFKKKNNKLINKLRNLNAEVVAEINEQDAYLDEDSQESNLEYDIE